VLHRLVEHCAQAVDQLSGDLRLEPARREGDQIDQAAGVGGQPRDASEDGIGYAQRNGGSRRREHLGDVERVAAGDGKAANGAMS
jgi:hypothetical protein